MGTRHTQIYIKEINLKEKTRMENGGVRGREREKLGKDMETRVRTLSVIQESPSMSEVRSLGCLPCWASTGGLG